MNYPDESTKQTCLFQTWTIPGVLGCCNLGRQWRHSNQQAEEMQMGWEDNSNDHINMWLSEVPRCFVQEWWHHPLKPEHVPIWVMRFCLQIPPPHHCSWTHHKVCVPWQGWWSLAHCRNSLVAVLRWGKCFVSTRGQRAQGPRGEHCTVLCMLSTLSSSAVPAKQHPCSGRSCHFNSSFLARA